MSAMDSTLPPETFGLVRSPDTGSKVSLRHGRIVTADGEQEYEVTASGIPVLAANCSVEGRIQMRHYDRMATEYARNLTFPHTQEYSAYLDGCLRSAVGDRRLGRTLELCCGTGEALSIFGNSIELGVGVDVSLPMLEAARRRLPTDTVSLIQGDATAVPLVSEAFETVFMLGGVHHITDRERLFSEVARLLRPGGVFVWREPVNDFWLWRAIRRVIYRFSPALEHETERPLRHADTVPLLEEVGLEVLEWRTYGFFGFALFMNSDVLVFNRAFRFIPGIRAIVRGAARFDDWLLRLPGCSRIGLQVIGVARKTRSEA